MKGLLIKDFYSISNYKRQYALLLVFMSVWSVFSKSFSFLSMYCILLGGMTVLSVMSMDEAVHFNRYALTMPVSVRTLVKEKYVLVCICIGIGSLLAFLVELIAMATPWYEGVDAWVMVECLSVFFLIAYMITLPIIFKYGVEKARYAYIAVMIAMAMGIFGMTYLIKDPAAMSFNNRNSLPDLLVLMGVLLVLEVATVLISYRVSFKMVEKKEW